MKLKELLEKAKTKRSGLMKELLESDDRETRDSLNALIEEQDELIRSYEQLIKEEEARAEAANNDDPAAGGNPAGDPEGLTRMAAFNLNQQQRAAEDPQGTLEYRRAFMTFCQTGECRADALTTTTDGAKVIPTTIMNEIVKELKIRGVIYNRVRKLNVQGGVEFPILSLKPTAKWIGETPASDRQKVQANTAVSFSYYGLECKVATSLVVSVTSLPEFEVIIRDAIVEAMMEALDKAVISGTGSGQPLGITADTRVKAGQKVSMLDTEIKSWESWKAALAKVPLAYKAGAVIAMAAQTWEQYIDGMVDTTGQPIARVNYNITEGIPERFAGKEVIQVEPDTIKDFDSAAKGDVVAVVFRPTDYGINSNMQMSIKRYFDEDKNEWVDKAILIADGKLIDAAGVILITKNVTTG